MRITFSKIKLGEFEDLRNFDVFINGNYCLNVVEGDGAYNDWYIQYSSEREIMLPELQDHDWQTSTEAKKDITKAFKKLGMAEIKRRAKRAHITMSSMRIESKLVKTSRAEADIKKWYNKAKRFRGFDPEDFPVLELTLEFDNGGKSLFDDYKSNGDEMNILIRFGEVDELVRYADEYLKVKPTRGIFKSRNKAMRDISKYLNGKMSKLKVDLILDVSTIHRGGRGDEYIEVPGASYRYSSMINSAKNVLLLINGR